MSLLTHLLLRPLCVSICVFCGYSWLRHLFLCLFGSWGRCGSCYTSCRRWGSPSPRVLWDELGFASEGISVLGWRGCVPTAQRDQQGRCILPSNPLISQERRLQASCVRVQVALKQIWLRRQKKCFYYTAMNKYSGLTIKLFIRSCYL